ncbi:hypothetical protein FDZ73_08615 [bacterium]|nr:MAG: hypothetical protein FDZ73_08615 [bacterium]
MYEIFGEFQPSLQGDFVFSAQTGECGINGFIFLGRLLEHVPDPVFFSFTNSATIGFDLDTCKVVC